MVRLELEQRIKGQLAIVAARAGDAQRMLDAGRPALEILAALADAEVQLEQASRRIASLFANAHRSPA